MSDFWERCVVAGCVIAPVPTYSEYVDGNVEQTKFIGLRYAAFPFNECAVGPDYWIMIDEGQAGLDKLYNTPEAALEAFEKRYAAKS